MTPTNSLTKAIINYLQFMGWYAVRINTQGQMRGGIWTKGATTPGTADIHACVKGKHVSIEVKTGKDKMSQAQKITKEKIEKAGGIYIEVRNIDEFVLIYNTKLII